MASPADWFRAMAERIERNDPDEFAGAFLIVPPPADDGSSGEVIEILFIDPRRDALNFWTAVRYYADKGKDLVERLAQNQPYGYGR